ncbi:VIT domain-containing protein [Aquabacterium sp.]|uniref:VIT domain-containing protein n=1 Tax=Aquabacterium sp. TaxID=1872578 RepID=UPI003784B65A
MSHESSAFQLVSRRDGQSAPVMSHAQVDARLDGLMFDLTLRQTYRNTSPDVLEVVYTFPLPVQAELLGFASELDGRRLEGQITACAQGSERYEQALKQGDAPVMLEIAMTAGRLHTANIGNLKPGQSIVLEVRFAQLLRIEQGRYRLAVPMTIAPRYGDPLAAGLQAQQVPESSLAVEYPLAFQMSVHGPLARATIECPSHAVRHWQEAGVQHLALASRAWLDRDLVLVVTPAGVQPSLALMAADRLDPDAPTVALLSLVPPPCPARPRLTLKLLVDCSGSMAGDGIGSARRALAGLADSLRPGDRVSLSRFGTGFEHLLPPALCSPGHLAQLRRHAASIEADMGGTEMDAALRNTFALADLEQADDDSADVLLITDGQYWHSDRVLAAALTSGHRVFVIGVGSAPVEGELRRLANETGGASEFALPGEALEAAARRSFLRMRQHTWRDLQIDWGSTPAWQLPLPAQVFEGDALVTLAGLPGTEPSRAVRVTALGAQGVRVTLAEVLAEPADGAQALPRLAAALRLAHEPPERKTALALRYQLLTTDTCCMLVHPRSAEERTQAATELRRMHSMLAAGWGGVGHVPPPSYMISMDAMALPSSSVSDINAFDSIVPAAPAAAAGAASSMHRAFVVPAAPAQRPPEPPAATLADLLSAVADHFRRHQPLTTLANTLGQWQAPPPVRQALGRLYRLGIDFDAAWVLLAHWHAQRHGDAERLALLRGPLRLIEPTLCAQGLAALDAPPAFSESPPAASPGRLQRLQQAMTRPRR